MFNVYILSVSSIMQASRLVILINMVYRISSDVKENKKCGGVKMKKMLKNGHRTRKLLLVATALPLSAAVLLSSCGGSTAGGGSTTTTGASESGATTTAAANSGEKTKISYIYWGAGAESTNPIEKRLFDLTVEFNQTNEKYELDYSQIAGTNYYVKLPALIAAGSAPDMFTIHASGKLKQYVDAGQVLPLTEYLDADPEWRDSFLPGAFRLLSWDDKAYAIPWYSSASPLYYNVEIFDQYGLKPPESYDDLKALIATLNENGVVPFTFGTRDPWTAALFMEVVANRIGGDKPYDNIIAGSGSWLDPSFVKAGEIMQELVALKAFPDDFEGLGADQQYAMFKSGETAMFLTGSWFTANVFNEDSLVNGKIKACKFPSMPGGVGDPDVWLGQPSENIAIARTSKVPEGCIEFLKMYTSDPVERFLGEDSGQIPSTKVALDPAKLDALTLEINDLLANSKGMFIFYDVGLGATIGDEFNNTVQAICGGTPVEEALNSLQTFTEQNRG
jgi:raffinose/stachyose/melibiose transport system substrate-binding protein